MEVCAEILKKYPIPDIKAKRPLYTKNTDIDYFLTYSPTNFLHRVCQSK